MRKLLRENSLSLVFGGMFLACLVGQAFAGLAEYNNQQQASALHTVSFWEYVRSADYAVDITENWQSEYLQFFLYIVLTVYLLQKGSPESKELDSVGRETDEEQKVGEYATADSPRWASSRSWVARLYSRSLGLTMGAIFVACWAAQSVAGWVAYNEQRLSQLQGPMSWPGYVTSADFWSRSLQNWQSEFLAIGSMAVLSIFLRERGSPESKPVGSAHDATGVSA